MKNVPQELSCFFHSKGFQVVFKQLLPKSNHPTFYSGGSEITNRGRINEVDALREVGQFKGPIFYTGWTEFRFDHFSSF